MSKALGIDDSVNACECCGRQNLKFTVVMELDDGSIAHYGQVCAARNSGKSQSAISREIKTEAERIRQEAAHAYQSHPARLAYEARLAERPRHLLGKPAMEFVKEASAAACLARASVAQAFGLQSCEVRG